MKFSFLLKIFIIAELFNHVIANNDPPVVVISDDSGIGNVPSQETICTCAKGARGIAGEQGRVGFNDFLGLFDEAQLNVTLNILLTQAIFQGITSCDSIDTQTLADVAQSVKEIGGKKLEIIKFDLNLYLSKKFRKTATSISTLTWTDVIERNLIRSLLDSSTCKSKETELLTRTEAAPIMITILRSIYGKKVIRSMHLIISCHVYKFFVPNTKYQPSSVSHDGIDKRRLVSLVDDQYKFDSKTKGYPEIDEKLIEEISDKVLVDEAFKDFDITKQSIVRCLVALRMRTMVEASNRSSKHIFDIDVALTFTEKIILFVSVAIA
ncbi:hypothetical protein HZS_1162, partial [Henneguya salminicola]